MFSLVDPENSHNLVGNGVVDEFGNIVAYFGINEDGSLCLALRPGTETRRFVNVEVLPEEWFV